MIDNSKEYVLCAAVHYADNESYKAQPKNIKTGFIICGRRHHNCIILLQSITNLPIDKKLMTQGFMTSLDRFVNRAEALKIAIEAGQFNGDRVLNDGKAKILISEDLY